ncbi:hypothetical protein J2J97_32520 (plasmid) [Rhizobium bangladeshense]|uniref:hypothetical protein n=1 Tax=Rhizobium bangladeshense TaxID=1138189 RepID=UPI001A9970B6|nr:hypothetical protein [Rhizobium bangladeshense]QSY98630.1 hypothetical protein J2J97_32520 [Rhizobium bangladeshense]
MNYDYTSRGDMAVLADEIRNSVKLRHPAFYAGVIARDIMRTRWSLHLSAWFVRKVRRCSRAQAWFHVLIELNKIDDTLFDNALEELAKHVEDGADQVDRRSAGGLSRPELITLLELMTACGWVDPRQVQPVAAPVEA